MLLFCLLLGVSGCSAWQVREQVGMFKELPVQELLDRLESRHQGLESLKALMAVHLSGQQPMMTRLSWVKPQQLRLTGFGFLGRTVFELVLDNGLIQWSEPGQPIVILGKIESANQREVIGAQDFPVTVNDLLFFMQGLTGSTIEEGENVFIEKTGSFYILQSVRFKEDLGHITKRIWIERKDFSITRQEFFNSENSVSLILEFEDYRDTIQGPWPHRVTIRKPQVDTHVVFIFRELKLNPSIGPDEFSIAAKGH